MIAARYEVVIVGAGSAGLTALKEVSKRTKDFLLVNDGHWGTTCARIGCMPSKVLIEAANAFERRRTFSEFGILGSEGLEVDLRTVLRRVRRLRDGFVAGTLKATDSLGERALSGRARFIGLNRLEVDGREITARSIVLAPGSRPVVPPAWRILQDRLLTTDTLFEQETLRAHIAVIGLGAVGVEMAQALARLGVTVTAFGRGHIGGLSDARVASAAADLLARDFSLHMGSSANVTLRDGSVNVDNGEVEATVDMVLAASGRRPNLDGLGLERLGIQLNERGFPRVDPATMQIGDLPLFLAGDATGEHAILHEAADEGHIAGLNAIRIAAGERPVCFMRRTPLSIVFSDPNIAIAGNRRQELREGSFVEGEVDFSRQSRARAGQRNKGLMRIYADRQSGLLLGTEMCVPEGEHMAHLLALAIDQRMTVHGLLRLPFYHPVLEEGLRSALRKIAAQLPQAGESDLMTCADFGETGAEALD